MERGKLEGHSSSDDYVDIDKNIITGARTISESVDSIQLEVDKEGDNDEEEPMQTPVCFRDIVNTLETIKCSVMLCNVSDEIMTLLSKFEGIDCSVATEKKKTGEDN